MKNKFPVTPLKRGYCKLRTAGLASVKSAMFGMVRRNADGSPRAHQGADLAADNGYRCYAVDDGIVTRVERGNNGYGWIVQIQLADTYDYKDVNGKPQYGRVWVFYAHLSEIKVRIGQAVKAGDVIGLTGSTGNARGMTDAARGAHLHFEVRTVERAGLGLAGRVDPLQFFDLD